MRLTENNIKFVKQMTVNGTTRKYAVILKSNYVSDIKIFTELKKDELPKSVQNFMSKHKRELFEEEIINGNEYKNYIFK